MQSEETRDLRSPSLSSISSSILTPRNSLEAETTILPRFCDPLIFEEKFTEATPSLFPNQRESDVASFFAGKSIFITGATGFVGKVLVEKLLRSCSDLEKIYVLIRPKKGVDPVKRLQNEFGDCELFRHVRRYNPDYVRKIIPVSGDLTKIDLGLSSSDVRLLQNEVSVVFHVAATIKFDEKLKLSLQLNVVASKQLIKIAKGMRRLESYQHISTAYAHCERPDIDEVIYEPPADAEQLQYSLDWMTDDMVKMITPSIIQKKPNTYTFTKAIAEHVVATEGNGLPISIVRPSIVGATWREPFPGWIDNYHGASGLMIACGKGLLPSIIGDAEATFDLIPVDVVVNNMISAAWHTAVKRPVKIPIYNCISSSVNPLKFKPFAMKVVDHFNKTPLQKQLRRPSGLRITKQGAIFDWSFFLKCKLPTLMIDVIFRVMGKKQRLSKMADLVSRSVYTLRYFTSNGWNWSSEGRTCLHNALTTEDKHTFSTDLTTLDWPSYIDAFCAGTKEYVLKETTANGNEDTHVTRSRLKRWALYSTVVSILAWVLLRKSKGLQNVWFALKVIVTYYSAVIACKLPC
ncbi:Fatty acyl-CoA reductase 1 [Holothuria leucospilota]|uniref:Fatty acyl-CoA reductase n=1 Tax=Holothuria leucospilota TaxID=206669 RepID=A0A9Q0YK77_HOLLE|nr:Fatty acyl-CoA reductase 1 [Holothuria leucospilota]